MLCQYFELSKKMLRCVCLALLPKQSCENYHGAGSGVKDIKYVHCLLHRLSSCKFINSPRQSGGWGEIADTVHGASQETETMQVSQRHKWKLICTLAASLLWILFLRTLMIF